MLKARFLAVSIILALLAALSLGPGVTAAQVITVDEASSGGTISLAAGDTLNVVLNQQTGSTGFAWGPVSNSSDQSVLQNAGHQVQPGTHLGQMGTDTWTYSALKAGVSTIYLEYSQSWSGYIGRSFSLTVQVLPPVPAASSLSIGLMTGGLAGALVFLIWRRFSAQKP
jgi:predicted secreted protein